MWLRGVTGMWLLGRAKLTEIRFNYMNYIAMKRYRTVSASVCYNVQSIA